MARISTDPPDDGRPGITDVDPRVICLLPKQAAALGLRAAVGQDHALVLRNPISAADLLRPEVNYGRARRWVPKVGEDGEPDLARSRVSGMSGYSQDGSLDHEHSVVTDFLAAKGRHIRAAGTAANSRGRLPKGVRGKDLIRQRIEQLTPGFIYTDACRDERAALVSQLLAPPRPVNAKALAEFWRVNRSTVWRLRKFGDAVQQKSVKGGKVFS